MKKIKIQKLDSIFSKCVRERAAWKCQVCGTYYPEGQRQGLHCSHFFSRRHYSTRWNPLNCAAHCYSCHSDLGGNPIEFAEWIKNHVGERYQELVDLKNTPMRFREKDKKEMYDHFMSELRRMQQKRDSGVTGTIEFSAWSGA